MTKYQLTKPGGPWDYPTLGFSATDGAILDGTLSTPAISTAPDAYWAVYGGGSAETGITRYGTGTVTPTPEVADGWVLAYSDASNTYVPTDPADTIVAALGGDSGRRDLDDLLGTTGKLFARVKNGLVTISFDPGRTGYAFWSSVGTVELPECLRPLPGFGFSLELRDFDGEPAGFAYIDGINFVLDYVLTNATGGITYAAGYPLDLNDLPGTAAPL